LAWIRRLCWLPVVGDRLCVQRHGFALACHHCRV
jgi:hypothetical protein